MVIGQLVEEVVDGPIGAFSGYCMLGTYGIEGH